MKNPTQTTSLASNLRIEIRSAKTNELAADAKWTDALIQLEEAAQQRMPASTLMRRVANVCEAEAEANAAKQRVELLKQIRDELLRVPN